jgi:rod shape determining protein RodA
MFVMFKNLRHLDAPIILILLLLMVISTAVILSATQGTRYDGFHIKNLIFYIVGFLVMLGTATFDYRLIVTQSRLIYGVGVLLLVLVLFYGVEINYAKSWFDLKIFNFQPAELVKVILIISIARYLSLREGEHLLFFRDIIPLGLIVFAPFVLVLIQPDLGNAVIYVVIMIGMFWIGNARLSHIVMGSSLFVMAIAVFVFLYFNYYDLFIKMVKPHQLERIQVFLDPTLDPKGAGYQVLQSIIAIGSGQLFGDGFLQGSSLQKGFIPYPYSDSIFVVIGEEYGFIGASTLILLYFLLIYRMVMIALQSQEMSGSYIVVGVISMFVFQIFENIGMLIGLMPLTGITLPFISYGGSSLIINMMSIGLVLSIKIHQHRLNFN